MNATTGVTLVATEDQRNELETAARGGLESGAVLLGALHQNGDCIRFVLTDIHWVPEDAYIERAHDGLKIASSGYVDALSKGADRNLVALWFHTHPTLEGHPHQSRRDRQVDEDLASTFRVRIDTDWYGHLILSPREHGIAYTGALNDERKTYVIDRLLTFGRTLRLELADPVPDDAPGDGSDADRHHSGTEADDLFSRNIAAFGGAVQNVLGKLRIGVIGAGGTGSGVAEQLVRLGVRDLLLVDPETLEASNVTRVYGSTAADVGATKVDTLAEHLRSIAPGLSIVTMLGSINTESIARAAAGRDVLFGCTDDNSGRMVLARVAYYARVPVIDVGIQLSTNHVGQLAGINGRVTTMRPGGACLICRDRIDLPRAAAEQMSHEEHRRLVGEGYAPDLPGIQPAVVPFTTMVAAQAVTELLELLTGFGPDPYPTEVLLRIHDREISTNTAEPRPGHFCDPVINAPAQLGTAPFLGKMWAE